MNIHELDSFKLSDAIKFNEDLNPKIWLPLGEMRPEVRQNLLSIAEDFQDFLGIPNLQIKDITVSGSNAAYTYTPHSDIDLHLVVEFPEGSDEIYRELFDAKKYQYNDEHDFRIGGYDVELYVQDADQVHHSQGIYSVKHNDWLSLPKRQADKVDDVSVRSKYEDMGKRIESAIKTGDLERMDAIATKVRELRQSGLDQAGEFSPENLAFKALRSTGVLDQLRAARHKAKSQALSLKERERAPQVRERVSYAYGTVEEETTAPQPATADLETQIKQFAEHCVAYLEIKNKPRLQLKRDPQWSQRNGTFGRFTPGINRIELSITGRHPVDTMRTLAHEYTHAKQHEIEKLPNNSGETGSVYEDEANAVAGRIMRNWVEQHPEYFEQSGIATEDIEEGMRDKLAAAAAAACIAGTPGCATTGADAIRTVQDVGRTAQTMRGYGSAGAKEEIVQRMKDELRRRQGHVVPEGATQEEYDPNRPPPTYNVNEAQISKNIQPILVKKGYAFLGKGQDQDAYLAPDGTVLKIFGYGPGGKLSQGQQSFKDFADYCMAKPNNPFLPQFGGWEPFDFEGKRYLQINCERMFDLSKSGLIMVGSRLGQLASLIQSNGADRGVNKFLRRHGDQETGKLMSLVGGRQQFLLLANTIEQLDKLANRKGYRLDLHGGNFMLGSDGEIVINDPFFTGNWRFDESINESLNQPYKILRWEKGDYGDVDAIARLDDNTFLSIMFNKGFSQDTKEEAWSVEFYRNNSQEKTGEGDQQRVFATVLSAIQTFVSDRVPGAKNKYKPNKLYFSASKEVKPDEDQRKALTRARLYDSLVQRYARALGFRAFRADTGNKVMYELSRIKPIPNTVAEASGYIPINDKEARDPRYSMAITVDIKPGEVQRQAKKMGWTTDAAGKPPLLMQELERNWKIIKEGREDLQQQDLLEINMSPSNLRQEAAKTGAQAGMEFEMIVPNVENDDDSDMEPDYEYDESVNSIQDAYDFFYDGDYNSRGDVTRLREKMQNEYYEWLNEAFDTRWDGDESEFVYNYLKENASEDEIAEILGTEPGDYGVYPEPDKQAYLDATEKVVEESYGNYWYDQARESAQEDFNQNADLESEWLESRDLNRMSDIENEYGMSWPHWQSLGGGELSIDDVADEFSRMIGKPINASQRYHGARREPGTYVVEPDGSLEADDSNDSGLEFVSPPMPIDEMLSDFNKVVAWAKRKGCYTNDSTGLHINVSVPNFDRSQLDFVKLAILMGDEYILDQFGRNGNFYTKSAMKIVKDRIAQEPANAQALLDKMKGQVEELASRAIHAGHTDKYTSINVKDGYIEFRSPGGDWLDSNLDKVENTLLRFTVALNAAMNPEMYREEYLKKLYKVLAPEGSDDSIKYFAKYAAGELPQSALKSFIRQAQLDRKIKADPTNGQKYWWSVGRPGYGASVQVVATSKEEAIAKGKAEYPDWDNATNMTAKPIKPYDDSPVKATVGEPQPAGSVGQDVTSPTGQWKIVDGLGREMYRFRPAQNTETKAKELAASWATEYHWDFNFDVIPVGHDDTATATSTPRPIPGVTDIEPDIRPGSTQDLQRQRATPGTFTGTWRVVDSDTGQELYRFSGIGNSQADANRVAADWLRQNAPEDSDMTQIEVLPIVS